MKKEYEVIWANMAESDLLKILEYIAQDSRSNALKILKKSKHKSLDYIIHLSAVALFQNYMNTA